MTIQSQYPSSADPHHDQRIKWIVFGIILATIGLALSAYSVFHHLAAKATGTTDFACNINSTLSCDAVANSAYSELAGIPLGVFGFGYFAAAIVLLALGLSRAKEHLQAYVMLTLIGVITSLGLGTLSATTIGAACVTCIGVYVITLLQLIHVYVGRTLVPRPWDWKGVLSGGTSAAIAVALVVALFNFAKPHTPKLANGGKPVKAPELALTAVDIPLSKSAYAGLGEDYRKGSDTARVVVQEFADYQCPACGAMNASGAGSSIHRRTCWPREASSADRRQHTPTSP